MKRRTETLVNLSTRTFLQVVALLFALMLAAIALTYLIFPFTARRSCKDTSTMKAWIYNRARNFSPHSSISIECCPSNITHLSISRRISLTTRRLAHG